MIGAEFQGAEFQVAEYQGAEFRGAEYQGAEGGVQGCFTGSCPSPPNAGRPPRPGILPAIARAGPLST